MINMASFDVLRFEQFPKREVFQMVRSKHLTIAGGWRDAILEVKNKCGPHPYLSFLEARWLHTRDLKRKMMELRREKRAESQLAWLTGGRESHYLKKFGKFGGSHPWLLKKLEKLTGCACRAQEEFDVPNSEEWAVSDDECVLVDRDDFVSGRLRKLPKRCEGCGIRGCNPEDGICGGLLRNLFDREYAEKVAKTRNPFLMLLLHTAIDKLREKRIGFLYKMKVLKVKKVRPVLTAVHQMDQPDEHGEGDVNIVQKVNTLLTEQHEGNISSEVASNFNIRSVSTDVVNDFRRLVDRPFVYQIVGWAESHSKDTELFSCSLPTDFIDKAQNTPNIMPFSVHRYFRGDIEIRVQLNANKFMMGQLQIAWYYQPEMDINFDNRNNIANNSQTLHTLLNAGTSNEAVLVIPYRYYKPMLEVGSREDKEYSLNMGKLFIRVLNPLKVTSSTSNTCYFTVFMNLTNAKFTGNVDKRLNVPSKPKPKFEATHQMEAAAGAMAIAAVSHMFDANRDNPTQSASPTFFSPQTAQSWSIGNSAAETLYSLRLDHAQVPHPQHYISDSFLVSDLVQRYGLVATGSWKASDASGVKLCSFPAVPMFNPDEYFPKTIKDQTCYILPPVAYLSNLFCFWRGTLKMRVDFVATSMHTGRVIIGYIPGDYKDDVTIDNLYSSTYVEYDLKEYQQIEYRVPMMMDKLYWPRHLDLHVAGKDVYAPGYVYMFVLAPLAVMDSIPNYIEFNIYWAGGEDFELAVPAQPTIGLSFDPTHVVPDTKKAKFKKGYSPFYTGTYTHLDINDQPYSTGQMFAICRYGVGYEHVSQIYMGTKTNYKDGPAYYLKIETGTKHEEYKLRTKQDAPPSIKVNCFVPWFDGDAIYLLPAISEGLAKEFIEKMLEHEGDYSKFFSDSLRPDRYFFPYWNDDADGYFDVVLDWVFTEVEVTKKVKYIPSAPPYDITSVYQNIYPPLFSATHQTGDNRFSDNTNLLDPIGPSTSTGHGATHFGENFNDLKNYTRRYQPYALISIDATKYKAYLPGEVIFSFPVLPQGLTLDKGSPAFPTPLTNVGRDGPIPLLLAGYRYFRGSLRFRIILPDAPGTFFIQHIPFVPLTSNTYKIKASKSAKTLDDFLNYSYAFTVQNKDINNVISIEIPYYVPYDSILLQRNSLYEGVGAKKHLKDYQLAQSLGEVRVGMLQNGSVNMKGASALFQISYSLGDDARPSVFQGFPPVVLTQNTPLVATHQMFSSIKKLVVAADTATEFSDKLNTLDLNRTSESVDETLTSLRTTSDSIHTALSSVSEMAKRGAVSFEAFIDTIKDTGAPHALIAALSHLIHVINNPTPSTMAISLCSFLCTLGLIAAESISSLMSLLTAFFSSLQPKQSNGDEATANHQAFGQEDGVAVASMLYMGISTAMNASHKASSKFTRGLATDLMDGVSSGCKDGSYFFRFLSNIIGTIVKIFEYIRSTLFPETFGVEHLLNDRELITTWAQESVYLCDVDIEPLYDTAPILVERVNASYIVGSLIMTKLLGIKTSGVNISGIKDLYAKVCHLRTVLADKGLCSAVRREPFVVCMLGEPGIGKSQMAHKTILNLLRVAQIPITTGPIYTHPAGAKYWECVNQEPAMFMDDSLVLRSGETMDSEISCLMSLKSSALFNPPVAECDRKKKRYAPELVYMHTNTAFPTLTNMQCPKALYRRRDMLWEASLIGPPVSAYTTTQLNDCEHLQFRYHLNPSDPNHIDRWSAYLPYNEFFRITSNRFIEFRNRMIETHAKKIDMFAAAIRETDVFPELNQMPLSEILHKYSNKFIMTDLTLYLDKAKQIADKYPAQHQMMSNSAYSIIDTTSFAMKYMSDPQVNCKYKSIISAICDNSFYHELGTYLYEHASKPTQIYRVKNVDLQVAIRLAVEEDEFYNILIDMFPASSNDVVFPSRDVLKESFIYQKLVLPSLVKPSPPSDPVDVSLPIVTATFTKRERKDHSQVLRQNLIDDMRALKIDPSNVDKLSECEKEQIRKRREDQIRRGFEKVKEDLQSYDEEKYTIEKIRECRAKQVTICDTHLDRFYKQLQISNMLAGKEIISGIPVDGDDNTRKAIYRKTIENFGCPHYFIAFRKRYQFNLTNCCTKEIGESNKGLRHWCYELDTVVGCNDECMAYEGLPIIDNFSSCSGSNCVYKTRKMLSDMRRMYHKFNPSTVRLTVDDDGSCPKILIPHRVKESMVQVKAWVTDWFVSIKNWLCNFVKKIYGKLAPIRNFFCKYKTMLISIFSAASIIAGGIFINRRMNAKGLTGVQGFRTLARSDANMVIDKVKDSTSALGTRVKNVFSRTSSPKDLNLPYNIDSDSTKILTDTSSLSDSNIAHQIIASGDPKSSNSVIRSNMIAKTIANVSSINPTASHQMSHEDVVANRIIDNTLHLVGFKVDASGEDIIESARVARALAIGDRYVLTVRHAWEVWQSFGLTSLKIIIKDRTVKIRIRDIKTSPLENSSLIVLRFPTNFPQFKCISKFFASELDHQYRCPSEGQVVTCGTYCKVYDCDIEVMHSPVTIDGLPGAERVELSGLYRYNTQGAGMCGSLLLGNKLSCPILGMHVAGHEALDFGYAEPLFRETFACLFGDKIVEIEEPNYLPVSNAKIDLTTTIFPVGCVGKAMAHSSPTNTAIHESSIHGYVTPKTAPAPLSKKDPRLPPDSPSPLVAGCEKHGILTKNFSPDVLSRTKERLKTHLFAKCKPLRNNRLLLTDQQAICGDPQLPYCDPLRWNSSEGYPYFNFRPAGATDKKWLFKLTETPSGLQFNGFNDLLGNIIEYKRVQRAQGHVQATIFTDCLKDARIPISKCSIPGKTRIFSMSPVDYTIDFRKYFYDFIASFQSRRLDNFNAIGINVFSREWDLLAKSLLRHPNICTGDYSNFGPGLNEEVARICLDIILEWYDEYDPDQTIDDARTRACLAYELIGAHHLCHDLVYKVVAGIPSGSPITVVLNSLVNIFYLFAAWDMLSYYWPIELRSFENFSSNIVLYTYGDDFIFSVSSLYAELFNSKILSDLFKKFDIVLTDAFKGEEVTPYSSISNSTFLKGSFVCFFDQYWYGLDKDQIFDMVNFVNSKFNKLELTKVNAGMALIHAHGHGKEFFNVVKSKLTIAFRAKKEAFQGRTFEEITDLKRQDAEDADMKKILKKLLPIF